jgi:integrase
VLRQSKAPRCKLRGELSKLVQSRYDIERSNLLPCRGEAGGANLPSARSTTGIGLLAVTGLRPGEALGLDRADVDLSEGALHVRAAKQNKHREVPLHDTTTIALRKYSRLRDRHRPVPSSSAFFVSHQGSRLTAGAFKATFAKLIGQIGLEGAGERTRPRAHDIRHLADARVMRPSGLFRLVRAVQVVILSA